TLPDQDGAFGKAGDVRLHPAGLERRWLRSWAEHAGRPRNWCDHSLENKPHRRPSAERLVSEAGGRVATVREWLEALVEDESPELAEQAAGARVVLTEREGLVAASSGVFRRSGSDVLGDDLRYVDERVLEQNVGETGTPAHVRRALDALGVYEADAAGRF